MDDFGMGYALGQSEDGRGNGMWGEGSWIWIILILALCGGWGNGFGNNAGNGALTRADLCSEFSFSDLQNGVRGIQQGLCDGFYALNNTVQNGFHGVDNAVCTLGYQTQQGFNGIGAQISSCCCETQRAIERGFCDVNYNMATQACDTRNLIQTTTRDIIDGQNANTRAILDFLTQDKITSLQAENQTLKFAASQAQQNAYLTANNEAQTAELIRRIAPMPVPSYQVPAPYPYCNNGCGNLCCA